VRLAAPSAPITAPAQPAGTTDLATVPVNGAGLQRIYGSSGNGAAGVPVAGGFDADDDGFNDTAFAAMRTSPLSRNNAGEIFLVFGNGQIDGGIDTAGNDPQVLHIIGDQIQENAGSELWMDDVTGDGLAPGTIDVGNLVLLNGAALVQRLFRGGFEEPAALRAPPQARAHHRL